MDVVTTNEANDLHRRATRIRLRDLRMVHMPAAYHKIQLLFPAGCASHLLRFIAQHDGITCRDG